MDDILAMEEIEAEQRQKMLSKVMEIINQELTEDQKYVLLGVLIQGKSQVDLAKEKGVNKSTICRMLHRALKKVRRYSQYL